MRAVHLWRPTRSAATVTTSQSAGAGCKRENRVATRRIFVLTPSFSEHTNEANRFRGNGGKHDQLCSSSDHISRRGYCSVLCGAGRTELHRRPNGRRTVFLKCFPAYPVMVEPFAQCRWRNFLHPKVGSCIAVSESARRNSVDEYSKAVSLCRRLADALDLNTFHGTL